MLEFKVEFIIKFKLVKLLELELIIEEFLLIIEGFLIVIEGFLIGLLKEEE